MTDLPPQESRLISQFASGTFWLGISSALTLVLSVISQVILGWLLVENDFGVFAVALGLTAFVEAFKDGGVGHWLMQRPRDAFETSLASSFWISVGFSVVVAILLAGAAPLAGRIYGDPGVTSVILVIAVSMPLSSYWTVASVKLAVDLRFRTLAAVSIGFPLLRTSLTVLLAALGFGPLSFVLPLVVGHIFTATAGFRATRLRPWHSSTVSRTTITNILKETKWAMGGTVATSVADRADYAILGLVITTPSVGLYYFAYQLPNRLAILFYGQMGRVIVPLLVQVRDNKQRLQDVVVRGAALLGVVSAPLFLGLALVVPDIEAIVWRGRWSGAVAPAQVLAALFPFEVLKRFATMTVRALGSFRFWTLIVLLQGTGLAFAALIAGLRFGDDVFLVSLTIGLFMTVSGIGAFFWIMSTSGARAAGAFGKFAVSYLWAAVAAAMGLFLTDRIDIDAGMTHLLSAGAIYTLVLAAGALMFRGQLTDLREFLRALRPR